MICSESYLFVLTLSSCLFVPIGLIVRTLLGMRQHVILPILRIRITTEPREMRSYRRLTAASVIQSKASPSIQSGRASW